MFILHTLSLCKIVRSSVILLLPLLIHRRLHLEWNNKILRLSLDCPLLIMSVNRMWTGFQPGSQISTGNMWQRYQKSYIFLSLTLYNKKISSKCNLTDQIEQVQDNICIYVHSTSHARLQFVFNSYSIHILLHKWEQ